MKLVFKTVREELDDKINHARNILNKEVKRIILTVSEYNELKAEFNYPDIEENQYGKMSLTYMGIPVEVEK